MIKRKSTALLIFGVNSCNPNGDPDWDGAPRVQNDHLIVSNVSMKRRQRDILADHSAIHFLDLAETHQFDPDQYHIFESFNRGFDCENAIESKEMALKLRKENERAFIQKYWDIRTFGTTALDDGFDFKRRGPCTIQHAISVSPVLISYMSITKKAPLQQDLLVKEQNGMAPQAVKMVNHAVCVAAIDVNPASVCDLETTEADIEMWKLLLKYQFSTSTSSARPANGLQILHIWWADHENSLGSFNPYSLWNGLLPVKKDDPNSPSTSYDDYHFPTPEEIGLNVGVVDLMREVE